MRLLEKHNIKHKDRREVPIRKRLRECLNEQGDTVTLSEKDVRYVLDKLDFIIADLRDCERRERQRSER